MCLTRCCYGFCYLGCTRQLALLPVWVSFGVLGFTFIILRWLLNFMQLSICACFLLLLVCLMFIVSVWFQARAHIGEQAGVLAFLLCACCKDLVPDRFPFSDSCVVVCVPFGEGILVYSGRSCSRC